MAQGREDVLAGGCSCRNGEEGETGRGSWRMHEGVFWSVCGRCPQDFLGRGLQMVGLWPGAGQRVREKDHELQGSFLKGER